MQEKLEFTLDFVHDGLTFQIQFCNGDIAVDQVRVIGGHAQYSRIYTAKWISGMNKGFGHTRLEYTSRMMNTEDFGLHTAVALEGCVKKVVSQHLESL